MRQKVELQYNNMETKKSLYFKRENFIESFEGDAVYSFPNNLKAYILSLLKKKNKSKTLPYWTWK